MLQADRADRELEGTRIRCRVVAASSSALCSQGVLAVAHDVVAGVVRQHIAGEARRRTLQAVAGYPQRRDGRAPPRLHTCASVAMFATVAQKLDIRSPGRSCPHPASAPHNALGLHTGARPWSKHHCRSGFPHIVELMEHWQDVGFHIRFAELALCPTSLARDAHVVA